MSLKLKVKYWLKQFPFIYPRGFIGSCQEWIINHGKQKGIYFRQRGPWFKAIFPAEFLHNPQPQTFGLQNEKAFQPNRSYPTPAATLFYLQHSYVLGHKGLILSASHKVFQEFSHHFNIASLKKFLLKNPFYLFTKNVKRVPGIGAVLISPQSDNYYHWLNDVLPRIKLYETVFEQIDHFCIASNVPAKFLDVLNDFGIPAGKIMLVNESEKLHFDHLYVSSLPGSEGRSPQWAVSYLRGKLIKATKARKPVKKIYFKRGDNADRKILNEHSIITDLQNNGFEIIDPGTLSISKQIELMLDAKIIVGAHGAALSNLLFVQDGISVVELFSPDYFRTDCYYTLSSLRNLNYWYLSGMKPAGADWGDMDIDKKLLLKTIKYLHG